MSKTRKVGNLFTHEEKQGFTYIQTWFVASADEATYTPTYGQDGDDAPFLFPADTYVYDWDKKPMADHFLITVNCHNDGYDDGGGGFNFLKEPTDSQRIFTLKDLILDPSWWGIIIADKQDTGETPRNAKDTGVAIIGPKLRIDADMIGPPYTKTSWCKEGDYIYNNATEASKGTVDYSKSPYTADSMATADPTIWAGKFVKTVLYTVRFYSTNNIMTYVNWVGVNGAGNGYFSPPNGCIPTGITAEGKWKGIDTVVTENAQTFNGTQYHQIERKMELAPSTLVWDKDKQFGGLWTW